MRNRATDSIVHTLDGQPIRVEKSVAPTRMRKKLRIPKKLLTILGILLLLVIIAGVAVAIPAKKTLNSINKLKADAQIAKDIAKSQDLVAMKDHLGIIESDLEQVQADYSVLGWLKFVPVARNYYLDGDRGIKAGQSTLSAAEIAIDAIAPYADVIGLKGLATTGDGAKTAQDRINFIVETLDKIKPQLSAIGEKLGEARDQVDQIDPNRYPQEFRGMKVRSQLVEGIQLLDDATSLINDAGPLLQSAPYILGKDKPRKYLVIFQNDAELRPTGGFMTGYAVIEVNKGKISTIESDDIYKLDERFPKKIAAPEPIKKYHLGDCYTLPLRSWLLYRQMPLL